MGLFSNEKKVDYDKIVDKMLPDAKKELDESQYDTQLGLNMARDARKVISGKLKIEDFHRVYSSSLTQEFGNYYASEAPETKTDPVALLSQLHSSGEGLPSSVAENYLAEVRQDR